MLALLFWILIGLVAIGVVSWSIYGVARFLDYFRRISSIGPNRP